jgi:3-deoxy-7-phosphoheptulonate synthase
MDVNHDIAERVAAGDGRIFGIMAESHLNPGRQDLVPGKELLYGVSITDACIGWDSSRDLLEELAAAVRERRLKAASEE